MLIIGREFIATADSLIHIETDGIDISVMLQLKNNLRYVSRGSVERPVGSLS
jgi:hypothetical protein